MPSSISVPAEQTAAGTWPSLTESKKARFAAIILLYFTQGVPVGLALIAIPAWLAANGATPVTVGAFVGIAVLPWSLKLFGGLMMDRFTFRPMGRRRAWIMAAQILMAITLVAFAVAAPSADEVRLLTALCFLLNVCAVLNDVATDGMTVDLVPHEERTTINGFMFSAQWLGIAVSGAVAGQFLASGQIALVGLLLAALVVGVSVFVALFRERPGESLMPWSSGQASPECEARQQEAWLPIFKGIFRGLFFPTTLFFLLATGLSQATYSFTDAVSPTLGVQQLGWTSDGYSNFASMSGFILGVAGALTAPVLVKTIGLRWSMVCVALALVACAGFAGLTYSSWQDTTVFKVIFGAQLFFATTIQVVSIVWAMRICDPAVAASLFAMFMAVPNFGRSLMSGWSGLVVEQSGYGGAYLFVAAISLISIVFFLLGRLGDERLVNAPLSKTN